MLTQKSTEGGDGTGTAQKSVSGTAENIHSGSVLDSISVASAPSPRQTNALSATQSLTRSHICDNCFEKFESTSALAMHHMKFHM